MKKVSTPIDSLLPFDSFFSPMPAYLRGLVIQTKPFEIEKIERKIYTGASFLDGLILSMVVGKEIFKDYPEIGEIYVEHIKQYINGPIGEIRLKTKGTFAYDSEDPFPEIFDI